MQQYPSKVIERAVEELAGFPGIGKKTALRLVLYLIKQPEHQVERLAESLVRLKTDIQHCQRCGNVAEAEICNICNNTLRDQQLICVVEDLRDVMAIENTGQFRGVYHLLGGLISPIDGVGPSDLSIDGLLNRVSQEGTRELIMALSATMEGDTTTFYITKRLKERQVEIPISTIARGIAIGGELEYADEITLGRSIVNRIPFQIG